MLNQNYLKVFENVSGSVTIISGHQSTDSEERIELSSITVSMDDLKTLSSALESIFICQHEETEEGNPNA